MGGSDGSSGGPSAPTGNAALSDTPPVPPSPSPNPAKPYIPAASIPSIFLVQPKDEDLLDLSRHNWPKWSKKIRRILCLCLGGLLGYVDGHVQCPDASIWPEENNIWLSNDEMVRSFCGHRAEGDDLRLIESASSAYDMWELLRQRHERQDPNAQTLLLLDLLNTRFDSSLPLADQGRDVIEHCERITAMGSLSANSLAVAALLNILGQDFRNVATAFVCELSSSETLTTDRIIRRLESEQQIINGRISSGAAPSQKRKRNKKSAPRRTPRPLPRL
ncbi:hypothetical protein L227DRAFT_577831 [Lentinus tigrinus ALCF2SS1-6]|uniref:Uncharacterized protein n=1 Tax=Lentinus tigrinus ALCF2SS1-6 TaxID=1328759 RepID=A0A5C2S222_9APHY|nr:hypothetical protein L227DRAFT_577831 [Lentinus tigrinus ALCF2SS1-6]